MIALVLAGAPVMAQESAPPVAQTPAPAAPPAEPTTPSYDEIVVIADRVRGQVETTSPPIVELTSEDVAAYGASSIADLVAQLAPQVGSGRGRGGQPVFLVNGQRITNFRELGRYPPESIKKVEVLPEEVALKFGYPADQRVINFILQDNFASREIEAEYGQPTSGGYSAQEVEASLLTINGSKRLNASAGYERRTPLTEAERGIVQATGAVAPGALDPADFRTLVARSATLTGNVTRTDALGDTPGSGNYTLNAQVVRSVTNSLSGLETIPTVGAIERRTATNTYSLGASLNKPLGDWQLATTLDATRGITRSSIDRPSANDRAITKTYTVDSLATLTGQPAQLPGGELSLTLNAGYRLNGIDSSDTRNVGAPVSLDRRRASGGVSLGVPITSRREDFGAAIGDLSLNLSGGLEHLSDFGTLWNYTTGVVWKPTERLGLQATWVAREAAPTLTNLGAATIVDFNVPTFDFRNGQTVLATITTGGNPFLLAEKQRDLKLSASYDFDLFERANLLVEYFRNRSEDVTASFPLLTPDVEAAFPGRVTRDASGNLTAIDARPVTFDSTRSERLRYGFSVFGKVGKPASQGEPGGAGGAAGAGQGGGRFGQSAVAPPMPPAGGEGAPAVAAAPGAGQRGPGGPGGGFDPARFAEMRAKFCATPDGQVPDLTGVPEQMLARLKDENGNIDPAKVAALKARFCAADGAGGPGGDGARRFDPARFAAMRTALGCGDEAKEPDIAGIPPEILERLKGPDGTVDPARLKEFKNRICALPAPAAAQPGGGQGGSDAGRRGGGGGGGGGMMRFGPGGGGGDGQGRWSLSLYHTVNLESRIRIAPGGPVLDLLNGDATGTGGGLSRHQVQLEGGLFHKGIGTRLSGNWSSGTTVLGSGLPGSSDLRFGDLATFDLRVFMALDQQKWLVGETPSSFWKGARLSFRVSNIFDAQQRVTDDTGTVPLRYQPGLIDPTGRFFEVEFRKVF